jgi:hypothetical protein
MNRPGRVIAFCLPTSSQEWLNPISRALRAAMLHARTACVTSRLINSSFSFPFHGFRGF